jgi:hypothetical protein
MGCGGWWTRVVSALAHTWPKFWWLPTFPTTQGNIHNSGPVKASGDLVLEIMLSCIVGLGKSLWICSFLFFFFIVY